MNKKSESGALVAAPQNKEGGTDIPQPFGLSFGAPIKTGTAKVFQSVGKGFDEWSVHSVADALEQNSDPTTDCWFSQNCWESNRRKQERWKYASFLSVDLDYHDAQGDHSKLPDGEKQNVIGLFEGSELPGNIGYTTPRGIRVIFLIDQVITSAIALDQATVCAAGFVVNVLNKSGIAASMDKSASSSLVFDNSSTVLTQCMRLHRCHAPGEENPRDEKLYVLGEKFLSLKELLADFDQDPNEKQEAPQGEKPSVDQEAIVFEVTDTEHIIEVLPRNRGSAQFTAKTQVDGELSAVHRDVFNPAVEKNRKTFVKAAAGPLGIDEAELSSIILEISCDPTVEKAIKADSFDSQSVETASYGYKGDEMYHYKQTANGVAPVKLSNFKARIRADVVMDDGVEPERYFKIQAKSPNLSRQFQIRASEFWSLNWIARELGASAIVMPSRGAREHLATAIQVLSKNIQDRVVYGHLGWRKIDGKQHYIGGNGAINSSGIVTDIDVELSGVTSRYELPAPLEGSALISAIKSVLFLLKMAPPEITYTLLGAVFRSVLGKCDLSIHLFGVTGSRKSELVARFQQFFGPMMDREHLPENWSSTANAIETAGFIAKDSLLVIDDFAPEGSPGDAQRLHKKADQVFRAQGNKAGRNRMFADGRLRPAKPPRCLFVSTGEEIPGGQSCRARLVLSEVKPNDVNLEVLSQAQQDGALGTYSGVMASFLQWLCDCYKQEQGRIRKHIEKWRTFPNMPHGRTSENLGNLFAGISVFVRFAVAHEAISYEEGKVITNEAKTVLQNVAHSQTQYLTHSDPAQKFLELLGSAISSGDAHIAMLDGSAPDECEAYGWDQGMIPTGKGKCVGWLEGETVYLHPSESFAVAQTLGTRINDAIAVSKKTVFRRMRDKGLLKEYEANRERLTVQKTIPALKSRLSLLCVDQTHIVSLVPSQPSQCDVTKDNTDTYVGDSGENNCLNGDGQFLSGGNDAA